MKNLMILISITFFSNITNARALECNLNAEGNTATSVFDLETLDYEYEGFAGDSDKLIWTISVDVEAFSEPVELPSEITIFVDYTKDFSGDIWNEYRIDLPLYESGAILLEETLSYKDNNGDLIYEGSLVCNYK